MKENKLNVKETKEITFIRHAQSLFNVGKSRHQRDCGITLGGELASRSIKGTVDCVVLSPLRRAIQTYALSEVKCGRVIVSNLFREHKNGTVSNYLSKEDIDLESEDELKQRIEIAIQFLRSLPYKQIAVFTHHDFMVEFTKKINKGKPVYMRNCDTIQVCLV